MRIIPLMPVRNEAWVLPHSLGALTAFCDVVIVSDQNSTDDSVRVCREFPKVTVIENSVSRVCEAARWQLLDAARDFDGTNLLWWMDADELISPAVASASLKTVWDELRPGTVVETVLPDDGCPDPVSHGVDLQAEPGERGSRRRSLVRLRPE